MHNLIRLFVIKKIINTLAPMDFRGKFRLLHYVCPHNIIIKHKLFGYKLELDLSDWVQRNIFLKTFYKSETDKIRQILKQGMTFFDVGANIGYFTLLASSIVGEDGAVFSFEPNNCLYNKIQKTISDNKIENIRLYKCALGDKNTRMHLYHNHPDNRNNTSTLVNVGQESSEMVDVYTLDYIVESNKIRTIHYMKVDVEGYEPNVICGAFSSIKHKKIQNMQIEFGNYLLTANGFKSEDFYNQIINLGFKDLHDNYIPADNEIDDRFFSLS